MVWDVLGPQSRLWQGSVCSWYQIHDSWSLLPWLSIKISSVVYIDYVPAWDTLGSIISAHQTFVYWNFPYCNLTSMQFTVPVNGMLKWTVVSDLARTGIYENPADNKKRGFVPVICGRFLFVWLTLRRVCAWKNGAFDDHSVHQSISWNLIMHDQFQSPWSQEFCDA